MTDLFRDLADAPEPGALTRGLWTRRVFVALFVLIAVLALADAVGQVTSTTTAQGPAARLALEAAQGRAGPTGAHGARGAGARARRADVPVADRGPRPARHRAPPLRPRPRVGR